MTRHSKVFVPVSAEKKYPDNESDYYFTIDSVERKSVVSGYDLYYNKIAKDTHWLEEKENVYVLTEDELKDLLLEFSKEMDTHYDFVIMPDRIYETRIEQFLQSKLTHKQKTNE